MRKFCPMEQGMSIRFYVYYSKDDIEFLRKELFAIEEYHNEGEKKKKNWHVYTLRRLPKNS